MTSETVEKNLDTTIASKVDHISKQLDYISGDGSGGSGDSGMVVPVYTVNPINVENGEYTVTCDMSYEEVIAAVREKKCSHCYVMNKSIPINAYTSLKLTYITDEEGYDSGNSIKFTNVDLDISSDQVSMEYEEILHCVNQIVYIHKYKIIPEK